MSLTTWLQRVLVVGASISSHEILHEALPHAEHPVYASIRGEPLPAFGWTPFKHPHIAVKKEISRLDPQTGRIFFADGTHVDGVDYVVFGTGFTFSLPWLSHVQERIKTAYRRLPGVYQHTWDIEDPTLTFVGMVRRPHPPFASTKPRQDKSGVSDRPQLGGGFTFRVYEWQAVAVARHLAGRARPLPPAAEQRAWERDRAARLRGGKDYYSIAPDYEAFFELLRGIAGDPAPGTAGRVLPPFERGWLDVWAGMTAPKIRRWEVEREKAEKEEERLKTKVKARL